jgi:hypothetical protein
LYKDDIDQNGLCDVHYWQAKAQRTWVGLTDDEIALIAADCSLVTSSDFYFAKAIESKIKELNT